MTLPACSPGCVACQKGEWLCVFLTYRCSADCPWCPAPFKGQDRIVSSLGSDPAAIATRLAEARFSGVAFSGGDCFLVPDRLLDWLSFFRRRFPRYYYWAYTNGLRLTERQLRTAAERGLNEIRFNISASGYDSPRLTRLMKAAAALFDHVTVEIPAIPEDVGRVVQVLPGLARAGVHFLNLHEFFITEAQRPSRSAFARRHIFNEVSELWYDARSRGAMRKIQAFCRKEKIPLRVHLCTLRRKDIQMRRRRQTMGRLLREPWERLAAGGFVETLLPLPSSLSEEDCLARLQRKGGTEEFKPLFLNPARARHQSPRLPGRLFRLTFLPPLEVGGERTLLRFEPVGPTRKVP
jgi:pyruvate formate-lyase activating enzyme-like uncharacterized protein